MISRCGNAHEGFRLLGPSDSGEQHQPATHAGAHQNLQQKKKKVL